MTDDGDALLAVPAVVDFRELATAALELASALDALLKHYRIGTRPPGKLLDRITRARARVEAAS